MKIFTYYEEINFKKQLELIELWKNSWKKHGLEPIVLSIHDAEAHEQYIHFKQNLDEIHKLIIGKQIGKYGMSCYNRWLAYATQNISTHFFVSDYDVICQNENTPTKNWDKIHLLDGACPCLAVGNSELFNYLCRSFIEISRNRLEEIKQIDPKPHYHDQEFFQCNFVDRFNVHAEKLRNNYLIDINRNHDIIGHFDYKNKTHINSWSVHYSHRSVNLAKMASNSDKSIDDLRINLITESLSI